MDLFNEGKIRSYEERTKKSSDVIEALRVESIAKINTYLSNRKIPLHYESIWLELNTSDQVALCIVENVLIECNDFTDTREDILSGLCIIYQELSVYKLMLKVKASCKTILSNILDIERGICIDWNEEELVPLVMKHLIINMRRFELNVENHKLINIANLNNWFKVPLSTLYIDSGDEHYKETDTSYKGIELRSPGHKKLCNRLEELGYMFFFEAPCKLLEDNKRYRRIDLIVVKNDRAVIVEVDGGTHRTVEQQKDDYDRDYLIRKQWSNTIRIEHGEALNETEKVIEKIISMLDPLRGVIKS